MKHRSPARKAATLVAAVLLAAFLLWKGSQVVIMSGTKSTFTLVQSKAPSGGSAPVSTTTLPASTKSMPAKPDGAN